jgi:hypothetical protein
MWQALTQNDGNLVLLRRYLQHEAGAVLLGYR